MLILKAVLLGTIQGITEFFPVSSSAHMTLFADLLDLEMDLGFVILLHLGTLLAVLLYFRREFVRCFRALTGIVKDLYYNLRQFTDYRGAPEGPAYRKIVSDSYRKITMLLVTSMVPTVILAVLICPLTEWLNGSLLGAGTGLLVTSLVLLVTSFTERRRKGPREAKYADAVLIGAFQGAASFPGISRLGMTLCGGRICGFSAKFTRLYAFLLLLPTIAGAMILEGGRQGWKGVSPGFLPGLCGLLCAFAAGWLTIRFAVKLISSASLFKGFSVYCACIGLVSIALYLM